VLTIACTFIYRIIFYLCRRGVLRQAIGFQIALSDKNSAAVTQYLAAKYLFRHAADAGAGAVSDGAASNVAATAGADIAGAVHGASDAIKNANSNVVSATPLAAPQKAQPLPSAAAPLLHSAASSSTSSSSSSSKTIAKPEASQRSPSGKGKSDDGKLLPSRLKSSSASSGVPASSSKYISQTKKHSAQEEDRAVAGSAALGAGSGAGGDAVVAVGVSNDVCKSQRDPFKGWHYYY
jgi:hypothetical protein